MEFTPIATGLYIEALAIDGDTIWFSDVVGGGVKRLSADGRVDTWFAETRWMASVLLNEDGAVLSGGPGGIAWIDPHGATGMLVEVLDGGPIGGVNEMTPDGFGGLYFGTVDLPALEAHEQLGPADLCRAQADGSVSSLRSGLRFSNGMALSLDGSVLYHNETFVGTFRFAVRDDGTLGEPTRFLDKPDCDGIAVDVEGRLWITGYASSEIICVRPDGTVDERVGLPDGKAATNIRFGGAAREDLYVATVPDDAGDKMAAGILPETEDSVIYRIPLGVAGAPIARTRFCIIHNR